MYEKYTNKLEQLGTIAAENIMRGVVVSGKI